MNGPDYMRRAIMLAKQAEGYTSPNPLVGAVIVKDSRIIGEGYHRSYGQLHAERDALNSCTESPEGADIYVTLEPCCHYGKQPPCTEAIIEAGIKRVIVGSRDPNPLVCGRGNEMLRQCGIIVETDYMKEECDAMNYVFFHYITHKTPYVVMKYAMTMDGKIAACTGDSKWVTGEEARKRVHEDRHRYSAIMVGVGTVIADNPSLTCRLEGKKNPIRIICDSNLSTPLSSTIVESANEVRTIIATTCTDLYRHEPYISKGCEIVTVNEVCGHTDLKELMKKLGEMTIDSVLLEGGGTLNWSAVNQGIINRVQTYIAPKIVGGDAAPSPVRGEGYKLMDQALRLSHISTERLGEDYLIESEVVNHVYGDN